MATARPRHTFGTILGPLDSNPDQTCSSVRCCLYRQDSSATTKLPPFSLLYKPSFCICKKKKMGFTLAYCAYCPHFFWLLLILSFMFLPNMANDICQERNIFFSSSDKHDKGGKERESQLLNQYSKLYMTAPLKHMISYCMVKHTT